MIATDSSHFLFVGVALISLSLYRPLNVFLKHGRTIKIAWDQHVPFIPVSVVPYLLFYGIMLAVSFGYALIVPIQQTKFFALSVIFSTTFSNLVFFFYPTYMEEFCVPGNSLCEKIIKQLYTVDHRFNAFPSVHVSMSVLLAYFLSLWFPLCTPLFYISSLLIIISTVTTKQHYLPDIPSGAVVGIVAILLARLFV